jgi:galactokinase
MASLAEVFRLSKEEVDNARPPGTATLIGEWLNYIHDE